MGSFVILLKMSHKGKWTHLSDLWHLSKSFRQWTVLRYEITGQGPGHRFSKSLLEMVKSLQGFVCRISELNTGLSIILMKSNDFNKTLLHFPKLTFNRQALLICRLVAAFSALYQVLHTQHAFQISALNLSESKLKTCFLEFLWYQPSHLLQQLPQKRSMTDILDLDVRHF